MSVNLKPPNPHMLRCTVQSPGSRKPGVAEALLENDGSFVSCYNVNPAGC